MVLELNKVLTREDAENFVKDVEKNDIDKYLNKEKLLYTYYATEPNDSIINHIINNGSKDSVIRTLNSAKNYLNDLLSKINDEYTTTYEILIKKYPNDEKIMDIIKNCTPPKLLFDNVKDIKTPFVKNKEFKYSIKDRKCIQYTNTKGEQKFITFIGNKGLENYKVKILDKPGETGVYCWVYYTDTNDEQKFKFAKVENVMELNTSHYAILNQLNDVVYIHIAGEMYYNAEEKGKETCYNFLSGTYTINIFEGYKDKFDIPAIEFGFQKIIRNYLNKEIPKCEPELETLINITLTPITKKTLDTYTDYGIVHITDTLQNCNNINTYYRHISYVNDPRTNPILRNQHKERTDKFKKLVEDTTYTREKLFTPEQSQEEKLENLEKEAAKKIEQINKEVTEVEEEVKRVVVLRRSERIAKKHKTKFGRSIRKFRKFHRSLRKKHIKKNL